MLLLWVVGFVGGRGVGGFEGIHSPVGVAGYTFREGKFKKKGE